MSGKSTLDMLYRIWIEQHSCWCMHKIRIHACMWYINGFNADIINQHPGEIGPYGGATLGELNTSTQTSRISRIYIYIYIHIYICVCVSDIFISYRYRYTVKLNHMKTISIFFYYIVCLDYVTQNKTLIYWTISWPKTNPYHHSRIPMSETYHIRVACGTAWGVYSCDASLQMSGQVWQF